MTEMYFEFLLYYFGENNIEKTTAHHKKLMLDKGYEQEWTHFCYSMSVEPIRSAKFPATKVERIMNDTLHTHG